MPTNISIVNEMYSKVNDVLQEVYSSEIITDEECLLILARLRDTLDKLDAELADIMRGKVE